MLQLLVKNYQFEVALNMHGIEPRCLVRQHDLFQINAERCSQGTKDYSLGELAYQLRINDRHEPELHWQNVFAL